jgi:hypothetical protein
MDMLCGFDEGLEGDPKEIGADPVLDPNAGGEGAIKKADEGDCIAEELTDETDVCPSDTGTEGVAISIGEEVISVC